MATSTSPTFLSSYTPVQKLGEGGYGQVWLVRRHSDSLLFAAKLIPDSKCRRKTWCETRQVHLPDEIVLWEGLQHPNLLTLHQIYLEEGTWILLMDFLDGYLDLFDYIAKVGAFPECHARNLLSQLVDVACYLLSKGVDHRDIKDENILYNPTTQTIKLIDFGSASLLPPAGQRYTKFQGTEIYIAPEFYNTGSCAPLPTTTWAIGCLAYVLLNGDSPFKSAVAVKEHKELEFRNKNLTPGARDFLGDVLVVDEEGRMNPVDILFHPWMQ